MESKAKESLVISVCPINKFGNYFVTASGVGNKDTESFIKIHKFDPQNHEDPIKTLAQVKVSINFTSIAWTRFGEDLNDHFMGFIVGGHKDGTITLWEASTILNSGENKKVNFGLLQSKKFHNSSVNCIRFNQKPSLFATGSKDIILISIDKNLTMESAMKCPSQDDSEITSLSWNDKVPHILAVATSSGAINIWEMKKTELFLTITDQGIQGDGSDEEYTRRENINTQVIWCNDGVQVVLAYDIPEYTFLTQYHMRQPNAPSAEYYGGHSQSIYDLAKNPNDANFFLSLGNDDVVTCWSIRTQKAISFITLQEKVSNIVWLNKTPDVFVSVTYDGNILFHQVNFCGDISNRNDQNDAPPRWLSKRSGVAFSFGGKFATFSDKNSSNLALHSLAGNEQLSNKMKIFIDKVQKADLSEVLDDKINQLVSNTKEKNASLFWIALKCVFSHNYNELFRSLGYDKTKLQNEVYTYIGKKVEKVQKKERQRITNINLNANNDEAEKFFMTEPFKKNEKENKDEVGKHSENEKPLTIQESVTRNINWNQGSEKLIKQSLLIGDLESAVDVALKCGRDAEALLIASAGNKELFNKAKQSFFNKNKDLFIKNIFSSIINGNFENLFEYNVLKDWKEYLLYAKTYQKDNEFLQFANSLGDRLANNPDIYMALVCYVLGQNYEKCIELLYNNFIKETEKINKNDKKIYLQHLFEQVIAVKSVLQTEETNNMTESIISDYCELLVNEGLYIEACSYLIKIKNNNHKILTLYDRIYNHVDNKLSNKFAKIQPPFNVIVVKPKIDKKVIQQTINTKKQITSNISQPVKDIFDSNPVIQSNTPVPNKKTSSPFPEANSQIKTNKQIMNQPTQIQKEPERVKEVHSNQTNQFNPIPTINPPKPILNKTNIVKPVVPPKLVKPEPEEVSNVTGKPNANSNYHTGTINPPKPNFNRIQPEQTKTLPTKTEKLVSPISSSTSQVVMSVDEEFVLNAFERYITHYNSVYADENKQKDFYNRVSDLMNKLKRNEIKINLLKLLVEFVNMFDSETNTQDLKKMQLKIQANGWDQNKTWMSSIEKLVNMPRK